MTKALKPLSSSAFTMLESADFCRLPFAAFLVLTFDGRYYAVSPQRLSRRNLGFPMASSADVWVHICHAPPFKLHLSAYIFLRKLKKRFSNQYCDSFYQHYVTNALTFLLSKLVYFNLSSFQTLFQLFFRSLYGAIPLTADVYRARKRIVLGILINLFWVNTADFCY